MEHRASKMLLPGAFGSLSHTTSAAITTSIADIIAIKRGGVFENNESTANSRARHFADWAATIDFKDISFSSTTSADTELIIAAYANHILKGNGLRSTTRPDQKTIRGYLRAAASFALATGHRDPRYRYDSEGHKICLIPLLTQIFSTVSKWSEGKAECQPLTLLMVKDIHLCAVTASKLGYPFGIACAIRDAVFLGAFIGSRVSEYTRGRTSKGEKWNCVDLQG